MRAATHRDQVIVSRAFGRPQHCSLQVRVRIRVRIRDSVRGRARARVRVIHTKIAIVRIGDMGR